MNYPPEIYSNFEIVEKDIYGEKHYGLEVSMKDEVTTEEIEELHQVEKDLHEYLYYRLTASGKKATSDVIRDCEDYVKDFIELSEGKYKFWPNEEVFNMLEAMEPIEATGSSLDHLATLEVIR